LRRLLTARIKPDFLFVEILPLFFNQPCEHTFEERYLNGGRLTASELAWLSTYHIEPRRLFFQWCKSRCLPWASHRTTFWEQVAPELSARGLDADTAMDCHGWNHFFVAEVTPEHRRYFTACTINQYRHFVGDFHLSKTAVQAMNDLLALCRQERIPIALVLMPEAGFFRAMYSPTPRTGLDAFVADLSHRWEVPVVDARNWIEDDGFWDGHHLVPHAADAFTDRLGRETRHYVDPDAAETVKYRVPGTENSGWTVMTQDSLSNTFRRTDWQSVRALRTDCQSVLRSCCWMAP
jgi:hypothetical protein